MQVGHQVTSSTSLQIPPQPETTVLRNRHPIPLNTVQPVLRAIINPKRGMEGSFQTPQPPRTCSSPGPAGKSCWSLDMRVAVLLMTLAGAVILLLLYRLLQLRHRLRLARARHALEYYSFFHSATYTLKHHPSCQDLPAKNGTVPEAANPATPAVIAPLPPPTGAFSSSCTATPPTSCPASTAAPRSTFSPSNTSCPGLPSPPACDPHHPAEPSPVMGRLLGRRRVLSDRSFQALQALQPLHPIESHTV